MKLFLPFLAATIGAFAGLGDVKSVYILPMTASLDQYLAIELTANSVFLVVTDPQKADVIITDQIGPGLDHKLEELFGPKQKAQAEEKDNADYGRGTLQGMTRARGAVFVIDRKTRNVIWSMYDRPKNTTANELNSVAKQIAGKMLKDSKGK